MIAATAATVDEDDPLGRWGSRRLIVRSPCQVCVDVDAHLDRVDERPVEAASTSIGEVTTPGGPASMAAAVALVNSCRISGRG